MGMSLVIASANVTEIQEVLKIVVSAMFGFRRFISIGVACSLACSMSSCQHTIGKTDKYSKEAGVGTELVM